MPERMQPPAALSARWIGVIVVASLCIQACLTETPAARGLAAHSRAASNRSSADSAAQQVDAQTAKQRTERLVNEIREAAYPELRGADVQVRLFKSESDYFRARFALSQFLIGRKMRYLLFANPEVFTREAPDAGVRAIIAHELAHLLYYSQRNRLELLGLVRLAGKGFTASFERWADLQAIKRGYGAGLKAYRQWLYRHIPARSLGEKQRDYFSPEEIDAILSATQTRPELLAYWLKHVPRNLKEILAAQGGTEKH